jgi:nucleotide-binding universal stress UspA family protein
MERYDGQEKAPERTRPFPDRDQSIAAARCPTGMDNMRSHDFGRILAATDFSASAATATERAAWLVQASGGILEVVHVIPPHATPVYRIAGWQGERHEVVVEATAKLKAMTDDLHAKFRIPVAYHVALGIPHLQISSRAAATGARLVVVGSRAKRSLGDVFIGSTARELRRTLPIPLLVARNPLTRSHERAVIATDLSPASAAAAHAAAALFPDAALDVLHVRNPLFESRLAMADGAMDAVSLYRNQELLVADRELASFIGDSGLPRHRVSSLVQHGDPPARIRQAAAELGATVVAFGTEDKSRLATLMAGVGAEFLHDSAHDILFAKAPSSALPHRPRDVSMPRGTVPT